MIIKLNKKDLEAVEAFVNERMKNVGLYRRRGGINRNHLISGAYGEIAAYKLLKKAGIQVTKPDFTIHSKKSYDADLCGDFYFHVKSQPHYQVPKYTKSWAMQKEDPILKVPMPDHHLILCVANVDTGEVEIVGCPSVSQMVDQDLFGNMKLKGLQSNKVAIYYNQLEEELNKKDLWGPLYVQYRTKA